MTSQGPRFTRRGMLKVLGGSAAFAVLPGCTNDKGSSPQSSAKTKPAPLVANSPLIKPASVDQRALIVIELPGGNDGLSTLIPLESGRYHDLRPTTALSGDDVVPFVDGYGLNAALKGLGPELAVVSGVGASSPTLSHFEMLSRWWSGNPGSATGPGFLGRLCDRLSPDGQFAGISIGTIPTPALTTTKGTSIGLPTAMRLRGSDPTDLAHDRMLRKALDAMAAAPPQGPGATNHRALSQLDGVDQMLAAVPNPTGQSEELATFKEQLDFAVRAIQAGVGIRIVHLNCATAAAFDTHEGHRERHAEVFGGFADGLRHLRQQVAAAGLEDRVLVATTSEFGRRAKENNGGLDHGTASVAILSGPVYPGLHGEPLSLNELDQDGNLLTSLDLARYYATLAAWLGVEPKSVLKGGATPLDRLVAI